MAKNTSNKGKPKPKRDPMSYVPAICERLATGEPMAVICRDLGLPVRTVNQWRQDHEEVALEFTQAFEEGMHRIAWRSRLTARGRTDGGGESTGDVQRDKLIVDLDLKLLSKWSYALYGDQSKIEHSGAVANVEMTHEQWLATLE